VQVEHTAAVSKSVGRVIQPKPTIVNVFIANTSSPIA
jgi:hypothetical protein